VDLSGSEEFGVEFGLQSPVLFQRSIIPAPGFFGTGSSTFTNPLMAGTNSLVPPGVTVNSTINPVAVPGLNFNQPSLPLGDNPVVNPGIVGLQGLGSLGVGRVSPTSGIGGFVFSAASDSFNLLIRALKTQGRIDILNGTKVMTVDNQSAGLLVGQSIPILSTSTITGSGASQGAVTYRNIGVQLQVTPKISPDGKVLMRVLPEISSLGQTFNLGNGIMQPSFNVQNVETTVIAVDGETVALGGLLSKRDEKHENKIPLLGDIPGIGVAFRYRTQQKMKTELLVILTPHVIRSTMDAHRILCREAARMNWCLSDVERLHGPLNCGDPKDGGVDGCLPDHPLLPSGPVQINPPPSGPEMIPPPVPVPSAPPPQPAPMPAALPAPTRGSKSEERGSKVDPVDQGKESGIWHANFLKQ